MFLSGFLRIALLFGAFGSFLLSVADDKNKDIYIENKGQFVKDAILAGKQALKKRSWGLRQLKENGKS